MKLGEYAWIYATHHVGGRCEGEPPTFPTHRKYHWPSARQLDGYARAFLKIGSEPGNVTPRVFDPPPPQ